MSDDKNKKDNKRQENKKSLKTKPSEKIDSPYVKLAIALEELCSDDFEFEEDDA
ncbi:hypothetical protein [uncultured Dysgonomonas sp.]|uniref:Uncharacterized protein n=1 Tax=uncultured Dysgonomonas sp. TaxID=206096 RepID=A0A212IW78_9BACT|nr:hypothetical protein [uncultured Dysgonomonas sp.]SBV91481.1 conserved hypothetical protein [uncultured Dysgonomonas sp.]